LWLVVLNESGEVESEYLVENVSPGIPLAMPNNHLVIVGPSEITLLDRHGVVKAQKVLTGRDRVTAVQSLTPDSQVRLFPIFSGPASALHTLGEHLEERGLSRGAGAMLVTNRAYVQPGGSLMLFGYQALSEPGGPKADTAAITRLSADLAKRESFFFQPLWTSNSIVDAVPTGQPGEFVTVRHVRAVKRWPNEKRTGLVIAFVRTQQTN
jgi:hypothetical protein